MSARGCAANSTTTQGYSACSLLCQQGHILLLQPNGTKMDLRFLAVPACIFLFEHMRAHYSYVSSHFRLCRPLRSSALPAGNSTDGKNNPEFIAVLCVIFPFQEAIFHLEPGRVESGKGKCSYDPKLNSVSALISEYHLASGCRLDPALPLVPTAPLPTCFFFPLYVLLFVEAFFFC